MEDKLNYWDNFYKEGNPPIAPSSFSEYAMDYINPQTTLLDIGCGNGRDSLFFESKGLEVTSIDSSKSVVFLGNPNKFHIADVVDMNFKADTYYARFFIHAISENLFDLFLENLNRLMSKTSKFTFETRSTKGITSLEKQETNFQSSIGEKHFRMLYSKNYLKKKLESHFKIDHLIELNGVANYKTDKPYVIRGVVSKK